MAKTLYTNVNIFDGSGTDLFAGEVLVEGRFITAVTTSGEPLARSDCTVIDGNGATLMPGMVESHAHLTWPSSVESMINTMKLPLEHHALVTAQNARITLDYGYTSAYSAGSLCESLEPTLRDMINAGYMPGPRLRASALEKGMEGVMGVPEGHDPSVDRDQAGLRQYILDKKAQGCDTIKFLLSSDEGFARGGSEVVLYDDAEVKLIGDAAQEAGIWLACHAQAKRAIKQALNSGFRMLYHCVHADNEIYDLMEAKKDQFFMAPAPGLLYARIHEAGDFGIGPKEAEAMGAVRGLEANARIVPELKKRGIRVLPGGDYGFPYNPVGRNARDLQIFVEMFGYSPAEALVAATKHGAEAVDWPVGEIAKGKWADILLIDGNPLEDIRILQHKSSIVAIMKDGEFYRSPPRHRTRD